LNKSFHFSYPVLTNRLNSGYKDDFYFTIESCGNQILNNNFEVSLSINLNSSNLSKLLKERKANLYIKVYADIYKNAFLSSFDNAINITIPINELLNNDTITITAYLLANENFDLKWNDEMEDVYKVVDSYSVRKNDILAISNFIKFYYYDSSESLIKLQKEEGLENKGFLISIKSPNYITIRVSPELNEAYAILRNSNEKKHIVNSTFAFIAISSALIQLANQIDFNDDYNYKEFPWFKVIENSFKLKGINLDDILDQYNENKDINIIFENTHIFINNNFERAFVEASHEN